MVFFLYLAFINFYIVQNNQFKKNNFTKNFSYYTNETYKANFQKEKIAYKNESKRNLEEYESIRIFIDTIYIESQIRDEHMKYIIPYMKEGINRAIEIISNLVKVKRLENGVNLLDMDRDYYEEELELSYANRNESLFTGNNNYDLIIFTKKIYMGESTNQRLFGRPSIIRTENGRPTAGIIFFNIIYNSNADNNTKTEIYTAVFLHEIIHILGFMENIFKTFSNYGNIFSEKIIQRFSNENKKQLIVKSTKIKKLAQDYYGYNNIEGLELENLNDIEGIGYSHWDGRILLGDIMTSELYFQDVTISDFTLALLEETGWYKIDKYTGGLMRFGKNKGYLFFEKDCLQLDTSSNKLLFNNEFCTQPYGSCSSGRLSKGICNTTINYRIRNGYDRNGISNSFNGEGFIDFCPVSSSKIYDEKIIIATCNFENKKYFSLLFNETNSDSNSLSTKFLEKYGDSSFCVLSSVLEKNDNDNKYKGKVRPTCYSMSCSQKSLTIELNNNEFIVCPREGGLIKIGRGDNYNYSQYKGYIFCPDFNLICTGTGEKLCNNITNCINERSEYKNPIYNYAIKNVPNAITDDIRNDTLLDNYPQIEGYELSTDSKAKCPINCSQCISNKRCILCRNFMNNEPYAYYIGEKDDNISHINCSEFKPKGGYYNTTKYINHIHFFRCVDNCDVCTNPEQCHQCFPEYKLNNYNKCIDRIDHCISYNNSTIFNDYLTNNGGKGYRECERCDNYNNYFCENMNKTVCSLVSDYSSNTYYNMEDRPYSCVQKCSIKFPHCIQCNRTSCKICEPEYIVNSNGNCVERIPHCNQYDNSVVIHDYKNNGGGESYPNCSQCDNHNSYYCLDMNKTICQYVEDYTDEKYFKMEDNEYPCIRNCSTKFPYCLKCNLTNCYECIIQMSKNGSCFPPISNCLEYERHDEGNYEYLDCKKCDQNNNYYCINNNKNNCEFVKSIENFYKIEDDEFSCLKNCEETFPECKICNRSFCFQCNENYVLSNKNKTKCLPYIRSPDDDICTVFIHENETNFKNIKDLEFEYFIDYYFINTLPYTNYVDHYIYENYTVTMFINSECTEDLLDKGHFKIDSKELYEEMYKMAEIESNELLFSIFITYNHQNHYRFYNIYTQYLNEEKICPNCKEIPFTITNKYISIISNIFGPSISSVIETEKIDIFSKESDIFTDSCKNLTIEGIDMPLNQRYFYLYLNDYTTLIACNGLNCEIEEIKSEESISICKCKIGNKFEDILDPIIEFNNYKDENNISSSSSLDSFKVIKCVKNGFNKKNILKNAGFFITLISIILFIACFIVYCICSKTIILPKGRNPPKKIKHRILLFSDWNKIEFNKSNDSNSIIDNDLVQSRDEDDGNFIEEDLTFSQKFDNSSSFSIDTEIGIKRNIKNNALSEKKSQKILVLLSNKKKRKKITDKKSDISSQEHEFIPTDDAIKRKKNVNFCKIYWLVLSLKQHIINFFSNIKCCKITESYIPLPIRFIRSIFMIILSFLLNILFLNQNYFSKKFKYFNEKYRLITIKTDEYTLESYEIANIPLNELWVYAFQHTFINAIIVFFVLLLAQFILGIAFFSLRNSVVEVIKKNDLNGIKYLITKTKIKYIIFFILSLSLLFLFLFTFIGFGGAYGGASVDYITPGFISILFLQIFPFIWSLIIAIFRYIGIKNEHKFCYDFSQFFLF